MMEKTMESKKKNNLEPIKGNKFAALHYDTLHNVACDVNTQVGC
jgi:hypothetical protein